MKTACSAPGHRRRALARARKCSTCSPRGPDVQRLECLQCGEAVDHFTCVPGYCRVCAHDPCWKSLEEAL
jgi:hypothetical protein